MGNGHWDRVANGRPLNSMVEHGGMTLEFIGLTMHVEAAVIGTHS